MITENNILKPVELAQNSIPVKLTTDNYITTEGVSVFKTYTISALQNGAGINWNWYWDDKDITFTTAINPDDSGLEIPMADNFVNVNDWVAEIGLALRANNILFEDYRIWTVANDIFVEAKNKGSQYQLFNDITITNPLNFSDNNYTFNGVDEVLDNNFRIKLVVYVLDYETTRFGFTYDVFKESKAYLLEPLSDSTATFYLESALTPHFKELAPPSFNLSGIEVKNYFLLKFYYKYAEKDGSNTFSKFKESNISYALNGGLKNKDFKIVNFHVDLLKNGSSSKFLSWHPENKVLRKGQQDFLYYIHTVTDQVFKVKYIYTETNGNSSVVYVTWKGAKQYETYIIPVSYSYLNQIIGGALIASFNVQILRDGPPIPLSETRSFKFVSDSIFEPQYFIYKNSLNAYESICFNGEHQKGIAIDKLQTRRIIKDTDSDLVNENVISHSRYHLTKKVFTGFKTQSELDYFVEFANSTSIFEQKEDRFIPVKVDLKKITLYKSSETISSAAIIVNYQSEKNYSNVQN